MDMKRNTYTAMSALDVISTYHSYRLGIYAGQQFFLVRNMNFLGEVKSGLEQRLVYQLRIKLVNVEILNYPSMLQVTETGISLAYTNFIQEAFGNTNRAQIFEFYRLMSGRMCGIQFIGLIEFFKIYADPYQEELTELAFSLLRMKLKNYSTLVFMKKDTSDLDPALLNNANFKPIEGKDYYVQCKYNRAMSISFVNDGGGE